MIRGGENIPIDFTHELHVKTLLIFCSNNWSFITHLSFFMVIRRASMVSLAVLRIFLPPYILTTISMLCTTIQF